ncbi:MAG: hypothetical protein MZU91_00245 [Desulfosudis oleivorans]|nr:hypothetical protein [Desulfosudis oleivorans]
MEIRDATALWGKDTEETKELMGDKKAGKMVIGPAGENLVKYAIVISQDRSHGRSGMGAVMGSKNLKGIVAKGNRKVELHDPEGFKALIKKWIDMLQVHPATGDFAPKFGTSGFLKSLSDHNALPTKNFSSGYFKDAQMLTGQTLAETRLVKNAGCRSCPIRCARIVELDGREIKGPSTRSCACWGPTCSSTTWTPSSAGTTSWTCSGSIRSPPGRCWALRRSSTRRACGRAGSSSGRRTTSRRS